MPEFPQIVFVDREGSRVPQRPPLRHARLFVDVVNDGDLEPVLEDLRRALMRTGHGPRIHITTGVTEYVPLPLDRLDHMEDEDLRERREAGEL